MEPEEARCVWAYMSRPPVLRFDAVDGASLQTLFTELGPAESVFLSVMINEFVLQLMEDLQDSLNDGLVEVGENPVVRAHWSAVIRTCEEHARLHPSVRRMIRTGDWMPAVATTWLLRFVTNEITLETWSLYLETVLQSSRQSSGTL